MEHPAKVKGVQRKKEQNTCEGRASIVFAEAVSRLGDPELGAAHKSQPASIRSNSLRIVSLLMLLIWGVAIWAGCIVIYTGSPLDP